MAGRYSAGGRSRSQSADFGARRRERDIAAEPRRGTRPVARPTTCPAPAVGLPPRQAPPIRSPRGASYVPPQGTPIRPSSRSAASGEISDADFSPVAGTRPRPPASGGQPPADEPPPAARPPGTTAPVSTTELLNSRAVCAALLALALSGCGSWGWGRRSAGPSGWGDADRQDPALSGNGRVLASVVRRDGRDTLLLQEQPSGTVLPLRHLQRLQPHRSPSLSWNGRYVAVLVQQGPERLPVIEDRASGRLHRLPLPGDLVPESLSLAPDGRRIAIALEGGGRSRVQVFDLSALLEPDLPGGLPVGGPAAATP